MTLRPILAWTVAVLLALSACSSDDTADSTTTTAPPETVPPAPSTSTTAAPSVEVTVSGATGDFRVELVRLYSLAIGENRPLPDAPAGLTTHVDGQADVDTISVEAAVTMAPVLDKQVAVATFADDVILAVSDDGDDWRLVGARLPSLGIGPWYGAEPHRIFVIGSDARPGEDPEKLRADSLHIVSVAPDGTSSSIVGIPRDSWVPAPYGRNDKFTNTMASRGPEVVVETASAVTGLDFDGYLVTGFAGFVDLVDAFGGFEIDIPFAMNEPKSKAYFQAGLQMVDGAQALAFARNRTLPGGDLTRQFHHGVIMQFALLAAQAQGFAELPRFLEVLTTHTTTDLVPGQLLQIGASALELQEVPVNLVAPGVVGTAGAASVVYLTDEATLLFEDLADGVLDDVPEEE